MIGPGTVTTTAVGAQVVVTGRLHEQPDAHLQWEYAEQVHQQPEARRASVACEGTQS